MKNVATWQVEGQEAATEAAGKLIARSAWFTVEPRPFNWYSFSVKAGEGHESVFNKPAPEVCARCGNTLSRGKCTDETCPFSDHIQTCPAGWQGHPEHASGPCACKACIRVEYDLAFFGGDYNKVGEFAYIPLVSIGSGGVEEAFEQKTGHKRVHIIHYSEDETFDPEGEPCKS